MGLADLTAMKDAPRAIRIGLIGPADQLPGPAGLVWKRCREPIAAKDERYPNSVPRLPRL